MNRGKLYYCAVWVGVIVISLTLWALIAVGVANASVPYTAMSNFPDCYSAADVTNNPYLATHRPNVLRLIIMRWMPAQQYDVGCVKTAEAAGMKVYLSIAYPNELSPVQAAAYFGRVIPEYDGSHAFAISVGNEQELQGDPTTLGGKTLVTATTPVQQEATPASTTYATVHSGQRYKVRIPVTYRVRVLKVYRVRVFGRLVNRSKWAWVTKPRTYRVRVKRGHRYVWQARTQYKYAWKTSATTRRVSVPHPAVYRTIMVTASRRSTQGEDYRAVWNAVQPVLQFMAPQAKEVFGEGAPWAWPMIEDAWHAGGSAPKHVDAVSFHAYDMWAAAGLVEVPAYSAEAASWHVPFWDSENTPALIRGGLVSNVNDTWQTWTAAVDATDAISPNVQMETVYYWPRLWGLSTN